MPRDHPSLPELRALLIPGPADDQWDRGELPRAVVHLESQSALRECHLLLRLACVARQSLDETEESRAVALREILLDLLPKDLDHPCCRVLRVLAGLEPGTAGRGREQRSQVAGSRIGTERHPATSRTVRRFARQRCWPWLLDRLIEREVSSGTGRSLLSIWLPSASARQNSTSAAAWLERLWRWPLPQRLPDWCSGCGTCGASSRQGADPLASRPSMSSWRAPSACRDVSINGTKIRLRPQTDRPCGTLPFTDCWQLPGWV